MKAERFVIVSDTHGDQLCPSASKAFFEFMQAWKPAVRVHLGDAFDLRRLRKKATEEEKREGMSDDVKAGCDFLKRFKPTLWIRGNHDERLWDLINGDNKALSETAYNVWLEIEEEVGTVPMLPYDKRKGVHRLGDYLLLHGMRTGIGATRNTALDYGCQVIHGHNHTMDVAVTGGLDARVSYGAGCLCKLDMEYCRATAATLRQQHGWLYGLQVHNRLIVYQAKKIGGKFHYASEVRSA